jgi:sec-independent protein translocase protein TatA
MFGIGMPELLVILVIVLIIFGAGKLPEIGSGLGKGIRNFKKATSGAEDIEEPEFNKEIGENENKK